MSESTKIADILNSNSVLLRAVWDVSSYATPHPFVANVVVDLYIFIVSFIRVFFFIFLCSFEQKKKKVCQILLLFISFSNSELSSTKDELAEQLHHISVPGAFATPHPQATLMSPGRIGGEQALRTALTSVSRARLIAQEAAAQMGNGF